jgi:aspartate/methionine/tyrosine aminotransferase
MPKATVDRFEEDRAVLIVDGRQVTRPRAELPAEAREGDVIDLDTGQVDRKATEELREQVRQARQRTRKKKAPPGSFDL